MNIKNIDTINGNLIIQSSGEMDALVCKMLSKQALLHSTDIQGQASNSDLKIKDPNATSLWKFNNKKLLSYALII